jgi:asparagine synthase (glutamine-hydrolysing)
MAREVLTPERLRRSGIFNPEFVRTVLDAEPRQRLRWHYFMLWQMMGVEIWQELFTESTSAPPVAGAATTVTREGA